MDIVTLLSPERILLVPELPSKKRMLELLAKLLSKGTSNLDAAQIFDVLVSREKLGSTTLGNGIAIPHACMPIQKPCAALLFSQEGIKMDAPDKKDVRLFLAILVPEHEAQSYSAMMAQLTLELVRNDLCNHIRHYNEPQLVMDYLIQHFSHDMAA